MAFQREVGGSAAQATDYHDLLTKQVQFYCSQHVATVVINNGGTGGTYVIGDVITLTPSTSSDHLVARFEVLTVSAGQILTMRILDSGAFAQQAASAVVGGAAGTGYVIGDILEVQGGTSRCPAKFQVATLSGSAVATVTLFEGGGVYSATPANDAATIGIGPTAFAGDDAATLTVTYTALTATTALAVTGGGGTGATVDITLAETGWTVDGRNTNNTTFNSLVNEKEVVLVGDATGFTNKPYIGYGTFSQTSGINERYIIGFVGLITHNPSIALSAQVSILGNPGTWSDGNPYLLCDEDQGQSMDFWLSADDLRVCGVININQGAANTDDGEYMHFYHGFMDTFATESEDPYPMYVFASSRQTNIDPSVGSANITGLAENIAPSGGAGPGHFFQAEAALWRPVTNSQSVTNQQRENVCSPMCRTTSINGSSDTDTIIAEGPIAFHTGFGSTNRLSPTVRLLPIPGTTPQHFPLPLTIIYRPGGVGLDETSDTPRGQLRGCFWIYNSDDAAATIVNFSEDFVTVGGPAPAGDRYPVFHTHVQNQLYHSICIKEDV